MADLVLYGGRVLTLDSARPVADAVAVSAGRILAVGGEGELRSYVTPHTQTLACTGQTVLPGFIDPHLHLCAWASRFCGIDLSAARSIAEIQKRLADHLSSLSGRDLSSENWLRGYGYDEFWLAEQRHPTKQDLDQVSREHPIIIRHRTGHAAVLNSAALSRTGIDRQFTPPAGGTIERDPRTGEPTGVVYESEKFLRTVVPPLPFHDFTASVQRASAELLRLGVTSFHDAGAGNTLEDFAFFCRLNAAGLLLSRVTVMIGIDALPQLLDARLAPFSGNDRVRLGSVKILLHESLGDLYPPVDDLKEMVWQVHRQGFQVAVHAVEEGPVCAALAAIETSQQRLPRVDHRHRIEHCAVCPPPFIDKLVETGTTVVTQPGFLYFYGEKYARAVDLDRQGWLYRTKSLRERGVPVAGSSDCPVAPLSPLIGVQTAMTRESQTGIRLNCQERLSLYDALALFTTAGAWIGFEEGQKGRIVPGMLADLIVLDGDLLVVQAKDISTLNVTTTIVGGDIVWTA